jgi:hypothetical protein
MSRYHRIRAFGPDDSFTPPYIWDTRMQKLIPYQNGEWDHVGDVWFPAIRGGVAGVTSYQMYSNLWLYANTASSLTSNGIALDSAYTYNSAGDSVGNRVILTEAKTLSSVYFYIVSFTGTAANVNDIDLELRNDGGTAVAPKPGATLHANVTVDPASGTGWKSGALSFAMSAATYYWILVADPDGGATDFATVGRFFTSVGSAVSATGSLMSGAQRMMNAITTTGWNIVTQHDGLMGRMVLVFTDGTAFGNPFSTRANPASSSDDRGLYIDGTQAKVKVWGIATLDGALPASVTSFHVYEGSATAPNAPTATGTVALTDVGSSSVRGYMLPSLYTVNKETPHRFTFGFSSNNTSIARLQIGTGADANLKKAMRGGGGWYWTQGSGTTWTDTDSEQPSMYIFAEDFFDQGGVSMSRVRLGM